MVQTPVGRRNKSVAMGAPKIAVFIRVNTAAFLRHHPPFQGGGTVSISLVYVTGCQPISTTTRHFLIRERPPVTKRIPIRVAAAYSPSSQRIDTLPFMVSQSNEDFEQLIRALRGALKDAVEAVAEVTPMLWSTNLIQTVEKGDGDSLRGFQEARLEVDDSIFQTIDRHVRIRLEETVFPTVIAVPEFRRRFLSDARGIELTQLNDPMWLRNTLTAPLLKRYLGRLSGELAWNDELFNSVANEFKTFMELPTITMLSKTSLKNFTMNVDLFDIQPNLRIERVPWAEAKTLYEESQEFGMSYEGFEYAKIEYAVIQETQVLPIPGVFHSNSSSPELVDSLIGALRILSPGFVHRGMNWSRYTEPNFILGGSSRSIPNRFAFVGGAPMELDVGTISTGPAILMNKMKSFDDSSLRIALRRFEYVYGRPLLEDQLIDIWIALEALFLDRGEKTETTDKISRRVGRLLGNDPTERAAIRRRTKDLYNDRSRLVHGDHLNQERILDSVSESLAILRLSLMKKLLGSWTVDSLEEDMMK